MSSDTSEGGHSRCFISRDRCPTCHKAELRTLYECSYESDPIRAYLERFYAPQGGVEFKYLAGAQYRLVQCQICLLVFQHHVPGDDLMLRLYEHWIDPEKAFQRHLTGAGLAMYGHYAQEVMAIIAWQRKAPSDIAILDFGMGWGRWARMARAFGCNVWGAELSSSRIAYAALNGIEALAWDDIAKHEFDVINTDQVFEHIPDPLVTLRHLVTALKPGGVIKLSVPDGTTILRRLKHARWDVPQTSRHSLHAVAPLEHINCFNRHALVHMAAAAGLEPSVMPMGLQYRFIPDFGSLKRLGRCLLLPIWRNILSRGTYMFFKRI